MISVLPSMYLAVKERIIKGVQFQTNKTITNTDHNPYVLISFLRWEIIRW